MASSRLRAAFIASALSASFAGAIESAQAAPSPSTSTSTVRGRLCGHPFSCEEARINSFSLVLRQNHHLYTRVVFNFLATAKKLSASDFYYRCSKEDLARTNPAASGHPRVQVFVRTAKDKKTLEKPPCTYEMHVQFFARQKNKNSAPDTTSGVLQIKFSDGDFLSGSFCAKESPRIIWDDETIVE